jgi:hypothetical protein
MNSPALYLKSKFQHMNKRALILISCLMYMFSAYAQTDTIKTDIIDVIKPFKAVLSEALKIPSNPNPEVPETTTPELVYKLPELRHSDVPTLYTIKPLSLGTQLLPKTKNNYTRMGYGNYQMPLFEVYMNTKRNRDYQLGTFIKHLSADGGNMQQFSNNTASIYGKRFIDNGIIDADLLYHRNVVNLYGAKRDDLTQGNMLRNQFDLIDANVSYGNVQKDTSKLTYKVGVNYYNYALNNNFSENNFKLSGNFRKSLDGNPINVYTAVQLNQSNILDTGYNRTFVDINPDYTLNINNRFKILLGFNSTTFVDSAGTKFHFFPKADVSYQIIPRAFTVFGGITGNLQRHTLRSITTENPFMRGIGFENTLNQFETYGGIRGIISPQTSFTVRASYATIKNMLFFGADSVIFSQHTIYDASAAGLTTITAELNHDFYDHFHFAFNMNYFGYDLSINAPYSRPTFITATNLWYNISSKFLVRGEVYTWNSRSILISNVEEQNMKGFVDLNLGFEYRYSKTVALFLNINNLANNKYERWFNLPVYGFNIMGGLGVSF